jgi:competence protein ComEC
MAGLALLARATGRTYAVLRALILAGVLMLLLNPLLLADDPGFQLSFVATLGLILLAPVLEARLGFMRSVFWRDLLAATLAAQSAVLPLLLYQTGLFSLVSLPANLLVLPFVPAAMALSFFGGVVGMALPALASLAGFPAYLLLTGIIEASRAAAALPLAAVTVPQFPFAIVVVAYAMLGYVIAKAPRPKDAEPRESLA